ncbi:MAG: DUF418 domain-containing protein [Bacteroidales bacterium]|nr:DUF418 domain-containing protein [Bacteroidales bacterium]
MKVSPTTSSERIISLDILRGFAILGILIMNIQSMSMINAAYLNPTAFGNLIGVNKLVWAISHVLADSKFMTIFSILFGAGIILFTDRLKAKGVKSLNIHYRRTFWLLVIGLLHAYLLWYGDILVAYAMSALWVVLLRKKKPRTLFIVGLIVVSIASLFYFFTGFSIPYMPEVSRQGMMESWLPSAEAISKEINLYTSSYLGQMEIRIPESIKMQTFLFFFYTGWRTSGLMLIGMALYKSGILSAQKSKLFYIKMIVIGLVLGYLIVGFGLYKNFIHNFSMEYSFFLGSQFNYWGSMLVSLGYIGLVMLLIKSFEKGWLANSLQAVGQTALSNYLIQTIIGTFIFYGHGLALFGKVDRWQQIVIVFGIWALQLIISPIWIRNFKFGPFEWLWRSLTYWKFQPWKQE